MVTRIPTMSMNAQGFSLSRVIPDKIGDTLCIEIDKENSEIHISRGPGKQMFLITYPAEAPVLRSPKLLKWVKQELGNKNFSKMPIEWNGDKFIVKVGEK